MPEASLDAKQGLPCRKGAEPDPDRRNQPRQRQPWALGAFLAPLHQQPLAAKGRALAGFPPNLKGRE